MPIGSDDISYRLSMEDGWSAPLGDFENDAVAAERAVEKLESRLRSLKVPSWVNDPTVTRGLSMPNAPWQSEPGGYNRAILEGDYKGELDAIRQAEAEFRALEDRGRQAEAALLRASAATRTAGMEAAAAGAAQSTAFQPIIGTADQAAAAIERMTRSLAATGMATGKSAKGMTELLTLASQQVARLDAELNQLHEKGLQIGGMTPGEVDRYGEVSAQLDKINAAAQTGNVNKLASALGLTSTTASKASSGMKGLAQGAQAAQGPVRNVRQELIQLGTGGQIALGVLQAMGLRLYGLAGAAGIGFAIMELERLGKQAIQTVYDLTEVGAKAMTIGTAYRTMSSAYGMDARALLSEMQVATRGTVDQTTLMIRANQSFMAGGANFARDLAEIMGNTRLVATALGRDIDYVMNSVIQGIAKGSPKLIDNAEIYLNIGQAVETYARSLGRTTDLLTTQERSTATAKATMEGLRQIVKNLGLDSASAADQMANLPAAITDVKTAMGELLTVTQVGGYTLPQYANALGEVLRQLAASATINRDVQDRISKLSSIGQVDEAQKLADAWKQMQEHGMQLKKGELPSQAMNRIMGEYIANADKIIGLANGQAAAEANRAAKVKDSADQTAYMNEVMTPYNAALSDALIKLTGISTIAGKIGSVGGALEGLVKGVPPLPELPKNFAFDTTALRAWMSAASNYSDKLQEITGLTYEDIAAFEQQQQAILNTAKSISDPVAAMQYLATATLGPQARIEDLIKVAGDMPIPFQEFIMSIGGFGTAFQAQMDKARSSILGSDEVRKQLQGVATAFNSMNLTGNIPMPAMPTNFNYDTGPLRKYLNTVLELNPALEADINIVRQQIATFESAQQGYLAQAMSVSNLGQRYRQLAIDLLGPGASIDDLIGKMGELPPAITAAINPADLLTAALQRLQNEASKPIEIDVRYGALTDALSSIDQMSLRLAGVLSPTQIRKWRDMASSEVAAYWNKIGATDQYGMDLEMATLLASFERQVDATTQHYSKMKEAAKGAFDDIAASAGEMEGKIKDAMNRGLDVTDTDMFDTLTGNYKDKALESARQLDDIAQHGREALSRHKDWIAKFQIPENLLVTTPEAEKQLKAWAAHFRDEVKSMTRYDLIDWDAFGAQWDAQQKEIESRNFTMDYAFNLLKDTGRLKGKTREEANKEIAKMFGIEEPKITIEAAFAKEKDKDIPADLVSQATNGKGSVDIPYVLVPKQQANQPSAFYNPETGGYQDYPYVPNEGYVPPKGQENADTALQYAQWQLKQLQLGLSGGTANAQSGFDAAVKGVSTATASSQIGSSLLTGITDHIAKNPIAESIGSTLYMQFAKAAKVFEAVGTFTGGRIIDATAAACEKGAPDLIKRIAKAVAPEVAAEMKRSGKGKTEQE